MRFIDALRIAFHIFSMNRVRTGLTILGISIGIGAIVFLISLGYGVQKLTIGRISSLAALEAIEVKPSTIGSSTLNQKAIEAIEVLPHVKTVIPIVTVSGRLMLDEASADVAVWGTEVGFFELEGRIITAGRTFKKEVAEAVVNSVALSFFNLEPSSALGKNVTIEYVQAESDVSGNVIAIPQVFTIVGVIPDFEASAIYLDVGWLETITDYDSLKVRATSQSQVEAAKQLIGAMGFVTESIIEQVDQLARAFRLVRVGLGLLGIIAVLVASIGMLNTMTISLLERIREIGIMKALGAADVDIWKLFLVESALIGLTGSALGLLIGTIVSKGVNSVINQIAIRNGGQAVSLFNTPLWFAIAMILFGIVVGVLTGFYPAYRAAKLNPLNALRYE